MPIIFDLIFPICDNFLNSLKKGETMKKTAAIFTLATMTATGAMAADFTPYVGLGLVVDKAGTSAKRMGFNPMANPPFAEGAGGDMDFDAVMAGEITAGVKYGHLRGEFEFALRGASEDDYDLYSGNLAMPVNPALPISMPGKIETSTSVKHNSYMANFYYDFSIDASSWAPYVGAGLGVGTYKQHAKVKLNFENGQIPDTTVARVDNDKTEFEWQVAVGTAYHFTPDWAADVAYRFNASTVGGEFVYAHEIKLGGRYSF